MSVRVDLKRNNDCNIIENESNSSNGKMIQCVSISTTRLTRSTRSQNNIESHRVKLIGRFLCWLTALRPGARRRHSSFLAVVPRTVGLDQTHTPLWPANSVVLHFALPCVTAYPVAPHPPTGFVPAPTQPPTYGGKIKKYNYLWLGMWVSIC